MRRNLIMFSLGVGLGLGLLILSQGSYAVITKGDELVLKQNAEKMDKLRQMIAQLSQSQDKNAAAAASAAAPLTAANLSPTPPPAASPVPSLPPIQDTPVAVPNIYDQAFNNTINQLLPMNEAQIKKLREVFAQTQNVVANPPGVPPRPTSSSISVDLSPQAAPPTIRLSAGYLTSLVFIDITGQPWPIASFSVGDPGAFNIQWDHKGNTLVIQSTTFYKRSNLAVTLKNFNTPIMITLLSGQEALDYRVDMRIPGIGPNAVTIPNGIPSGTDNILFDVLNGVTPKGSKELKIKGGGAATQAWLLDKKLYVRTNLTIVSPAWQSTMTSADGTHAYQLQPVPVLLALQDGKDKNLTLTLEGL